MTAAATLLPDFIHLLSQVVSIDVDPASIGEKTELAGDLMLDSISLVSLVALCEERFRIDLSDQVDSIANIQTVGDALALIAAAAPATPSTVH
ncbi:MAG TPA: phosphopantetheine-binding protein [Paucimonas sp.]|nr:phosphopantetheine-binding protein [Paucimonas sp.]